MEAFQNSTPLSTVWVGDQPEVERDAQLEAQVLGGITTDTAHEGPISSSTMSTELSNGMKSFHIKTPLFHTKYYEF